MQANILVVDDEKEIADLIELYLANEGFTVTKFYEGVPALAAVQKSNFDLAVLDIMLPDLDGFRICQKIRETYTFPIIMLTAKGEAMDKITGLTIGADDYMTKPFNPLELVARVKAHLRRATRYNEEKSASIFDFGGLYINKATHACTYNEKKLSLTPTEFSILWILCENRGQVVSSERLFEKAWGEKYDPGCNNTVMVHIRHLREKMQASARQPGLIQTVWGVGYKIE